MRTTLASKLQKYSHFGISPKGSFVFELWRFVINFCNFMGLFFFIDNLSWLNLVIRLKFENLRLWLKQATMTKRTIKELILGFLIDLVHVSIILQFEGK